MPSAETPIPVPSPFVLNITLRDIAAEKALREKRANDNLARIGQVRAMLSATEAHWSAIDADCVARGLGHLPLAEIRRLLGIKPIVEKVEKA